MDKLKSEIKNNKIDDIKIKINNIKDIKIKKNNINNLSLNFKKLSYVMNLVNYTINNNFLERKNIINLLKNDINNSLNLNLKKKIYLIC